MERDYKKQQFIQWLRAEMAQVAGRSYPRLDLDSLHKDNLREPQRPLRDLDSERRMVAQHGRTTPWRMP